MIWSEKKQEKFKKWNKRRWFFLSAQSEHISTPITKPVEAPCSTGNFHEESPKQISCERTEISHLEKQIFILKRWEALILALLFWLVLIRYILLNVVCNVYITCKTNILL